MPNHTKPIEAEDLVASKGLHLHGDKLVRIVSLDTLVQITRQLQTDTRRFVIQELYNNRILVELIQPSGVDLMVLPVFPGVFDEQHNRWVVLRPLDRASADAGEWNKLFEEIPLWNQSQTSVSLTSTKRRQINYGPRRRPRSVGFSDSKNSTTWKKRFKRG